MGKRNTDPLPEEVEFLRMKVQEWRRVKAGPGEPMPKEIWEAAIRLAHSFGVCRIARATGLDYVWLRKKLERRSRPAPDVSPAPAPTFLEVPVELVMPEVARHKGEKAGPLASDGVGSVIEVVAPDGSRMRIQVGPGGLDAPGILAAFLGRPH